MFALMHEAHWSRFHRFLLHAPKRSTLEKTANTASHDWSSENINHSLYSLENNTKI